MREATRIPREIPVDAVKRLRRLRALAWFLDQSVRVGRNGRFGLDPVLGLIPVVGDWLGAALSMYVVYEALLLGLPWRVLGRMLGNIAIEAVIGAVPVAGDIFDFVWQANTRNLQLVERYYHPRFSPRSPASIAVFFAVVVAILVGFLAIALWLGIWLMNALIDRFWPAM